MVGKAGCSRPVKLSRPNKDPAPLQLVYNCSYQAQTYGNRPLLPSSNLRPLPRSVVLASEKSDLALEGRTSIYDNCFRSWCLLGLGFGRCFRRGSRIPEVHHSFDQ